MNPVAEESYRVMGFALVSLGRLSDAERVLRESTALPHSGPYARAALGYALARWGRREEAEALCAELTKEAESSYVSPVAFGTLCLGLGRYDEALDWAQKSINERRGWFAYAKVNPIFDPVRSHPRFQLMVAALEAKTS
jgi:tetratricopeptide (TPR) repeat protein